MSRREEVEAKIAQINPGADDVMCFIWALEECRTLADEVDFCAAPPWRFDTENAPTGNGLFLCMVFCLDRPTPQLSLGNIEAYRRNGFEITAWSGPILPPVREAK